MNISYNRKRRDPTREGQIPVQYAPAKRTLANLKWRLRKVNMSCDSNNMQINL